MADDTQQAEIVATETQQPAVPTGEQITTEVTTVTTQDGLPENASDRTKHEFEKLTSELREERQRREAVEAAFKSMQPKVEAQDPIYDPNTGLLNEQVFSDVQRKANDAEKRALKAEESVKNYLLQQENQRAYESHPELNPDGKQFDKKLHREARALILDSMMNPQDYEGKQFSLKEAGDFLKGSTTSAVEEAKKVAAQEAIEQLTPKEQATLEATGVSSRRSEVAPSLDTLKLQTRRGNQDAIVERMKALKTS